MDLKRLVIPDKESKRSGAAWKIVVLCLVCAACGYILATLTNGPDRTAGQENANSSAGSANTHNKSRSFTAGGWIEVASPAWPIVVTCRISERLESLSVREGQTVEPGKVIATMYDKDIRSRLDLARAELKLAQKKLEKFRAGFRKEDIAAAKAKAEEAAEKLRIARSVYEASKSLDAGAISREALDKDLSAYKQAEAAYAAAAAELNKYRAGYRVEEIAMAQAEMENARSKVALAERELDYCTITAPDTGSKLRVFRVLHHVGQWIDASKQPDLVWLYDPGQMQARVDVRQPDIMSVTVGQDVEVVTEANPEKRYRGTVLRIDPLAELAKNTVTVRVKIDDPDDLLFPEMVAQITFLQKGEEK
jgi:HlyD family secretion protein